MDLSMLCGRMKVPYNWRHTNGTVSGSEYTISWQLAPPQNAQAQVHCTSTLHIGICTHCSSHLLFHTVTEQKTFCKGTCMGRDQLEGPKSYCHLWRNNGFPNLHQYPWSWSSSLSSINLPRWWQTNAWCKTMTQNIHVQVHVPQKWQKC